MSSALSTVIDAGISFNGVSYLVAVTTRVSRVVTEAFSSPPHQSAVITVTTRIDISAFSAFIFISLDCSAYKRQMSTG